MSTWTHLYNKKIFFPEVLSDRFAIASQNQINVVLSAQQLVDCDTDNEACKGGWPIRAWQYMVRTGWVYAISFQMKSACVLIYLYEVMNQDLTLWPTYRHTNCSIFRIIWCVNRMHRGMLGNKQDGYVVSTCWFPAGPCDTTLMWSSPT